MSDQRKPFKSGDVSDMAHRIKVNNRRDYGETELALIAKGRDVEANARWHERTGK